MESLDDVTKFSLIDSIREFPDDTLSKLALFDLMEESSFNKLSKWCRNHLHKINRLIACYDFDRYYIEDYLEFLNPVLIEICKLNSSQVINRVENDLTLSSSIINTEDNKCDEVNFKIKDGCINNISCSFFFWYTHFEILYKSFPLNNVSLFKVTPRQHSDGWFFLPYLETFLDRQCTYIPESWRELMPGYDPKNKWVHSDTEEEAVKKVNATALIWAKKEIESKSLEESVKVGAEPTL